MDRQHRHDLKHDKFVDEIGALSVRARANQRMLLTLALVVLAVALIGSGIFFYRSNREKTAQAALSTAIGTAEATVGDQRPPNATGPHFKTEAERMTAAEKQFRDVQSQFPGTHAADVASLYVARILAGKGDIKGARTLLEDFVGDHEDNILGRSARFSLYQLRIENGEAAQMSKELEEELKKAEPVLPGDSLLVLLAQSYDVQGNTAKSRETYRRITTEFPESPYVVEATRRGGQA